MFAFGYYDRVQGTLIRARDRIGIKPLFFHQGPDGIAFASELKALTSTMDLRPDKARIIRSVFGYLQHTRHYSAFERLRQVSPGSYVTFSRDGRVTRGEYFRTADLVDRDLYRELDRMPPDAVLDAFERLLQESVRRMLVADAPIGAFVSGGVDSSLLSAVAKQCGKNPRLYSVNVVGRFSEIDSARDLAEVLQTEVNVFDFEPQMFLRDLVKTTWHNDAPLVINLHAVAFENITRVAFHERDKAVLTGEGADELFLGYPQHARARLERALRRPLDALQVLYARAPGLRSLQLSQGNGPGSLEEMEEQYEDLEEEQHYAEAVSFLPTPHLRDMQRRILKLIDKTLYSLLWRNDRMGMMHSIESRFPYLDEPILRFAASLPLKYKMRATPRLGDIRHPFMVDKYVIRKLASRHLPERLTARPTRAFPIHGLETVRVAADFFAGGFWQDLLGLTDAHLGYMTENTPPGLLAKIAAVGVWGRLFCRNESVESVHDWLDRHCEMVLPKGAES